MRPDKPRPLKPTRRKQPIARGICRADVTNSQRSPGFGCRDRFAESRVLRGVAGAGLERDAIARNAEIVEQRQQKLRLGRLVAEQAGIATGIDDARLGIGPRQLGQAKIRPASPVTAGAPYSRDSPGEIAPPRTTMPSGAPRAGSQGGKRLSSTCESMAPNGRQPGHQQQDRLTMPRRRPSAAQPRRHAARGREAQLTSSRFDGSSSSGDGLGQDEEHGNRNAPRRPAASRLPRRLARLLPVLVTLLVLFIGRIETGQLCALLHFLHQPGFEQFVLGAFIGDEVDQRRPGSPPRRRRRPRSCRRGKSRSRHSRSARSSRRRSVD